MRERKRRGFTLAEKTELWDRWQRGESLNGIGRAFGKLECAKGYRRRQRHPTQIWVPCSRSASWPLPMSTRSISCFTSVSSSSLTNYARGRVPEDFR